MGGTIVKLFQKQNFVIGEDILKAIKKNNLTLNEALLIIYFCGNNLHPVLDIDEIKNKFGMEDLEIMQAFDSITSKNLVKIKMEKNKDNKMEEIIDLTHFYESLAMDFDEEKRKDSAKSVYSIFEAEFGRPLSSMEFQIINNWLDKNINEGLIEFALKEAIFNGTLTLRYIDAILMEWVRKGFKTEKDVNLYLRKRKNSKSNYKTTDLFDYNWLDDDE